MPIEYGDVEWPPRYVRPANELYRVWGAWYSGDPAQLADVYSNGTPWVASSLDRGPLVRPSQFSGGVVGKLARFWWGRPTTAAQPAAKLHIPAASDLSMFSADLLFGEPPDITIVAPSSDGKLATVDPVQAEFDRIADEIGLISRLLESAEQQSALGGVYLRESIPPADKSGFRPVEAPVLEAIPAECAVPEWSAGFLVAVTFWRVLGGDAKSGDVYRHLERHEPGRVYHALYKGTEEKLGRPVPLQDRPETEAYAAEGLLDESGGYSTGASGLAVQYVPNMRPHRVIKGTPLGRSDYSGAEPVMDALDETWSSLMRDIRIGKGRIVAPEAFLTSQGNGNGAIFEIDREVFVGIETMPGAGADNLTVSQFAIRVEEHLRTAMSQIRQIWRTAGYSAGANGEAMDGAGGAAAPATATEVSSRDARTGSTRERKTRYWTPELRRAVRVLSEMNGAAFGKPAMELDAQVMIEWPPSVSVSPLIEAQTLNLLSQARAASTRTLVQLLNPQWDDTAVDAEVALIEQRETDAGASDPALFG